MNGEDKIDKRDLFAEMLKEGMRSLPVKQVLSSPIVSCVKAQQKLSETALDSLIAQAFEAERREKAYHTAFVSFSYNQNGVAKRINVPLLLLVPYQPLEIKEASFSFSGNLYRTDATLITDARRGRSFKGRKTANENLKINFNVKVNPSDTTIGLSKLVQFCTESVVVESCRENAAPPNINPIWPNPIWPDPTRPSYPYPFPFVNSYRPLGSGSSSGGALDLEGIIDSINLPRPISYSGSFVSYSSYKGSYQSYSSFGRRTGRSSFPYSNRGKVTSFERAVRISSCLWLGIPGSGSGTLGLSLEGILDSINRIKRKRYRRGVLFTRPFRIPKGVRKKRK